MALSRAGKPRSWANLRRRDFLIRFCQGAGATLIPSRFWDLTLGGVGPGGVANADFSYHLRPHYRNEGPLDSVLANVQTGFDEFISEKYADQIAVVLAGWSSSLLRWPGKMDEFASSMAPDFSGASLEPVESRIVRSGLIEVRRNQFATHSELDRAAFLEALRASLNTFSRITTAEFQITGITGDGGGGISENTSGLETRILYEIVGEGAAFHREQRVGECNLIWQASPSGSFLVRSWLPIEEFRARSRSPVYQDITASAFADASSYTVQMLHGSDYWRTVLDGASGIDIYGHNGISVADIDNDGFDDLYVCQPAGLPNRLYRNRGDGAFEDITDASGLGVLENTTCALFADYNNDGWQDVVIVRAKGPTLFLNQGGGKFREKPDAFRFATPPQGTFTGAAVADYDRDGWLDIYFCLYAFYQGTGQYKYPSPYHDANNGPPNFLMRNNRDGTFHDVTAQSGLNRNNTRYSFCCGWSDSNRDGWPDLYVVNDFGRKNLYRNNGDGTFTDVAQLDGVEDVGAGMSVSWLDYENEEAQDLYVANMWTAAGERISSQDIFKKDSPKDIRELYQKHAAGNSLLHNLGTSFEDATKSCGVGMGRWSWSSDAFDFDHDGYPDIYIANGMVSGPSRKDLNSFFWRQVVAKSPDEPRASKDYERGWDAINQLIRSDGTWSGYERNVFYANNRDGTFSDVSAVVGLDFVEDGRSFALADFDHDGRLEILLKNRNAPQLRILRNVVIALPPSIVFRLEGTKSNRDAIGAAITIETAAGRQTRMLQAGSGFLSQHTKDVFFGLGMTGSKVTAAIRWPSGLVQELRDLPINHKIWVEEGSAPARMEPFRSVPLIQRSPADLSSEADSLPNRVETWLLEPIPAPDFALQDFAGRARTLSGFRGKPVLLYLWSTEGTWAFEDLKTLFNRTRWASQNIHIVTVHVAGGAPVVNDQLNSPYVLLRGSEDFVAVYNILYRQLFDRHCDLTLPTSFLIDAGGNIVKVYQGPIDLVHLENDFKHIPQSDAERLARALPFPSTTHTLEFGRNYLSYGALYFQRGYLDQAEASFQQAFREDPSSAEALYGIGSVYLKQNKNDTAREVFERVVKLQASYPDTLPDAWNNLGVIATRGGRVEDSVRCFQQALQLNPNHLPSLDNLANAYRALKRWDEAGKVLDRALEIAPEDPDANYSMGMVFAQANDTDKAYEYLQRALKAKPDYPEALNNLGVLYLRTKRRDQAVASFEECIRRAPSFDQAYLNLARVYAVEGDYGKARSVLLDLLKQHPDHEQATQLLNQLQK